MIMIDCHMHLHESMVSLPGLLASMDRFGIERTALMARLNPPFNQIPQPLRIMAPQLRKALHGAGGWRHAGALKMYRICARDDGTVLLGAKKYEITPQPDNSEVTQAVTAHPDRFWGWIFVNPSGPEEPLSEIEKHSKTPGMIGVKAHPYWHHYPVSDLEDTAALCAEKGMPMLIHLGAGQHGDFRLLPQKFPALNVIYAHAGVPYGEQVCDFARESKNVFVDLSSSAYVAIKTAAKAVARAGADKCLFGTDGPYFHASGDRFDYGERIDLITALGLSQEDRTRVERINFTDILG
jgi:predicted TIM-barrel fold metal-dependent hydrolase